MNKELRLKPLKEANELSAFVNTIYDNFFHQISNFEDTLSKETNSLQYLVTKIKLDEVRNALRMFENVVDSCTEYMEVEAKE